MMRIAVGGFFHESNTFNPILTGPEDFIVFEQDEIYANRNAYLLAKGVIEFFEYNPDYLIVPLVFAKAVPNGEIEESFYLHLKQRFFDILADSLPVDAFVLALHGSMRVKNIGSAESDLLAEIKKRYPNCPVFCGLDMHATMTKTMLACAEGFVGFKTAPHLDAYETGYHAAQMADLHLKGNHLTMASAHIPCLIAGEKSETDCEPMKSLISRLKTMESEEDVCAASYLLGFPWADTEENGVTALVVTYNNPEKARQYADALAELFRTKKDMFAFSSPSFHPEEALILALNEEVKPVFVSDSGDNPTAGSTGDNTTMIGLLSGQLKSKCINKKILLAGIYDPVAVKKCISLFQQPIEISIGGNYDSHY